MSQPDSFYTLGTLSAEAPTIEGRRAQPGRCQVSGHSCLFSSESSSFFLLLLLLLCPFFDFLKRLSIRCLKQETELTSLATELMES